MTDPVTLSQQQEAMTAFTSTSGRGLQMYWEHLAFPLEDTSELARAARAVQVLRDTHAALRHGATAGRVERDVPPAPVVPVSSAAEAGRLLGLLRADTDGPLLRAYLVDAGVLDERAVLWLAVHHLVTDGISQSLIVDQVLAVIGGGPVAAGSDAERFAVAQRAWWPAARAAYSAYFAERFRDADWHTGIVGRLPGVHDDAPAARWQQRVLAATPTELRRAGGALRATATAVTMTAWIGSALAHVPRPVVATHTAGRSREERSAVGYFANALLLAPDLRGVSSVRDRVHLVRDEVLAGADYQRAHVDTVAREVLGHNDPYTMLFTVVDERREQGGRPRGAAADIVPIDDATRRDLCVYVTIGDDLRVDVLSRTAAYRPDSVLAAIDAFDEGLTGLLRSVAGGA